MLISNFVLFVFLDFFFVFILIFNVCILFIIFLNNFCIRRYFYNYDIYFELNIKILFLFGINLVVFLFIKRVV